ncbi:uncharacterized protein CLUP02_00860 [Colletotrichum lupini]|uniref:Uncharacterized protein n=1 Tax=Colletotrichum lupini TaxID=145971 RepID=A0A9Q8W958_9PEZI|nr:uncharacterized protein CLUP02_00860 [Colletotrichum lupini]UQC74212.1 hypothetical protein CLUP02_00860 [Colletotrichum lupini]
MLFARKICAIGREKESGREVGGEGSLPGVKARIAIPYLPVPPHAHGNDQSTYGAAAKLGPAPALHFTSFRFFSGKLMFPSPPEVPFYLKHWTLHSSGHLSTPKGTKRRGVDVAAAQHPSFPPALTWRVEPCQCTTDARHRWLVHTDSSPFRNLLFTLPSRPATYTSSSSASAEARMKLQWRMESAFLYPLGSPFFPSNVLVQSHSSPPPALQYLYTVSPYFGE